ncbi:unnamed protein product [Linum trigynum]|uniref:Plant heme peroxidase family profile domain-containing protein n=1 Tax=Linum trigynum TaxID=586398 RepID=A0AAV2ENG7_9ROSI
MLSPWAKVTILINLFAWYNLLVKDLVALSSSHSIGKGRCFSIQFRLFTGMMKEVSGGDDEDDGQIHGMVERNDDGLAVKK